MKILSIIGVWPQIIKTATLSRTIKTHDSYQVEEVIIYAEHRFYENMSALFLKTWTLLRPKFNLST